MESKERALQRRLIGLGLLLTLAVLVADSLHWLDAPESWSYDHRVRWCQHSRKAPSDQIVQVDIDDQSLKELGRWPWSRSKVALLINELSLAGPKVIGLDMNFPDSDLGPDGTATITSDDRQLADAIKRAGNVLLPISVEFKHTTPPDPIRAAMVQALIGNLELTSDQMYELLVRRGFAREVVEHQVNVFFTADLDAAMMERLNQAIAAGTTDLEALRKQLLPREYASGIHDKASKLLFEDYLPAMSNKATDRFVLPPDPKMPLASALSAAAANVPIFADAARYCGFIDLPPSEDGTVRSVPLMINYHQGMLPHMSLSLACAMLDVKPSGIHCSPRSITLSSPRRGEIVIPVHTDQSASLGTVGAVMDIPYFGKWNDWTTMFDYPNYREAAAHLSINNIWNIVELGQAVSQNNAKADQALRNIAKFSGSRPAEEFVKNIPDASDTAARVAAINDTLKDLDKLGLSQLADVPDAQLSEDQKPAAMLIRNLRHFGQHLQEENDKSLEFLSEARADLRKRLFDKAVIVGWTADEVVDFHPTSLHALCPGEVIQATILNGILTGQLWRELPKWNTLIATLIFGLLASLIVASLSPLRALAATIGLAGAYILINGEVLFDYGHLILGAAGPLMAIAVAWAGCSLARLIAEGIERIRVARDLAVRHHELDLAKNVQQALIPKTMPMITGLESSGWTKAADVTGGDLFDLWTLPDGRLGILLADASGHGLAASIIVSQVRSLVRLAVEMEDDPDAVLSRLNARLSQDLEGDRFVTAFLGFLSPDGELEWASAGHAPILWRDSAAGEMQSLDASALPLGAIPEYLGERMPPLQLKTTGMLIVISDGIIEAPDPTGSQFGIERVINILNDLRDKPSDEISSGLRKEVTTWQAKSQPADDQTIIIIRRVESGVTVSVDAEVEENVSLDDRVNELNDPVLPN